MSSFLSNSCRGLSCDVGVVAGSTVFFGVAVDDDAALWPRRGPSSGLDQTMPPFPAKLGHTNGYECTLRCVCGHASTRGPLRAFGLGESPNGTLRWPWLVTTQFLWFLRGPAVYNVHQCSGLFPTARRTFRRFSLRLGPRQHAHPQTPISLTRRTWLAQTSP